MTGKELAEWIKARGWTQRKAAEYLGVTEAAVSRYVHGQRPISRPVAKLIDRSK